MNSSFEQSSKDEWNSQKEELKDSAFEDSHDTLSYDRKSETASKSPCLSELSVMNNTVRSATPPLRTSSRDFRALNTSLTSLNSMNHILSHEKRSSIGSRSHLTSKVSLHSLNGSKKGSLKSKRSLSSSRLSLVSKRLSRGSMKSRDSPSPKRKRRFAFFKRWFPRTFPKRKSLIVTPKKSQSQLKEDPPIESPLEKEEKLLEETADSPALSSVVESIRNFSVTDASHNYSLVNLASLARTYHKASSSSVSILDSTNNEMHSSNPTEEMDVQSEYAHKVEMIHDPSSSSSDLEGSQAVIQDMSQPFNFNGSVVEKTMSTPDLSNLEIVNASQSSLPMRKSSSESLASHPKRTSKFPIFTWTKGYYGFKRKGSIRERRSVLHLW